MRWSAIAKRASVLRPKVWESLSFMPSGDRGHRDRNSAETRDPFQRVPWGFPMRPLANDSKGEREISRLPVKVLRYMHGVSARAGNGSLAEKLSEVKTTIDAVNAYAAVRNAKVFWRGQANHTWPLSSSLVRRLIRRAPSPGSSRRRSRAGCSRGRRSRSCVPSAA